MGELETAAEQTRSEIASYFREFADKLEAGGEVTLQLGGEQVTLNPANPVTFKLEGESDWAEGETEAKQSIEFELVWRRDVESAADAQLDIETEGN